MPRAQAAQLNIRSDFARERATALAKRTGMTTTQVIEEALRAYVPPPEEVIPEGLVRSGPLLVARGTGRVITLEETNAALDEERSERGL